MRLYSKILCLLVASLTTLSAMADVMPAIKVDSIVVEDNFVMPKDAPYFSEADNKMKSVKINERLFLEQLIAQLLLLAKEGKR